MEDFVHAYSGLIATVVSGVCSVALAVAGWYGVRLISKIDALHELCAALAIEVKLAAQKSESLHKDLGKTETRIDDQQKIIITLIERIAVVTTKLEAVFRYIDAPKRATDGGS